VLADENTWIVIDKPSDLAGLSDGLKKTYKAAADERKLTGKWAVVNTRSSVDPFLASVVAPRPAREGVEGVQEPRRQRRRERHQRDDRPKIVKLRAERAKLLGYPSHAHWRMYRHDGQVDPAKAQELMMRVWPAAVARVREEVADMQKLAKEKATSWFEPWDYLYYAEKVRKAKYALDQDELKPYFELNNMIARRSTWPSSSTA
jgi:peptidyl-dipeptidase Dcp